MTKIDKELHPVNGVTLSVAETGMKYKGRPDLLLAEFTEETTVAGVFTQSACPSAPVDWCKTILKNGKARALVCNAGNANAFTGVTGKQSTAAIAEITATELGVDTDLIFMAATGVIGEPLDDELIQKHIADISSKTEQTNHQVWKSAAQAICTTDTYPKAVSEVIEIDGVNVSITGIAKGSGMIAPDMATMLGFIFTDAPIAPDILQTILLESADKSFNSISVDSDTSTSDTVLLFATGQASIKPITDLDDPRINTFTEAINSINHDLAKQIVKDGEGASKFIEINVSGADSDSSAKKIAFSIGNSPLVKTALGAGDANWGRIVMAIGKAGERADRDKIRILFGNVLVAENGAIAKNYDEELATKELQNDEIQVNVELAIGEGKATIWTCDLTHEYVSINADYRS